MKRKQRGNGPWRVQVVVDGGLEYFREVVLGVRQAGFASGRWEFADRWLPHEGMDYAALVRRDRIDGIVAAVHDERSRARFAATGVPVVNVSNSFGGEKLPLVTQDDEGVGRVAAEHLADCGRMTAGFVGQAGASYARERLAGFRAGWAERAPGAEVAVLEVGPGGGGGKARYARMRRWLAGLPVGLGVFVVLDEWALELIRAARELGRRVPEDVAVLGAGNDDFWVEFESVPLSSVRLPAREIGREAGRLLDELITHGRRRAAARRLPVSEVVARRSTDTVFGGDEAVGRAVRFIRTEATRNPYVAEVVRAAGVSRTALQQRFRAVLGRSVREEVERVRVEAAKRLLRTTELKLAVVAERCGWPNSQRFSVCFRAVTGVAPGRWRRRTIK